MEEGVDTFNQNDIVIQIFPKPIVSLISDDEGIMSWSETFVIPGQFLNSYDSKL